MSVHGRQQAAEFTAWLKSLDAEELENYRVEIEAFAGDPTRFGAFATVALPAIEAAQARRAGVDLLRAILDETFPDLDPDVTADALATLDRARRALATDTDLTELLDGAVEVAIRRQTENGV